MYNIILIVSISIINVYSNPFFEPNIFNTLLLSKILIILFYFYCTDQVEYPKLFMINNDAVINIIDNIAPEHEVILEEYNEIHETSDNEDDNDEMEEYSGAVKDDNNRECLREKIDNNKNINDNSEEICDLITNENEASEIAEIRAWAVTCNISIKHLDKLLNILRKKLLPQLPKSGKTFLETTKASYNIRPMHAADNTVGEFVYLGLEQRLASYINADIHVSNIIHLQINVDGASPFDSSCKQL